MRTYTKEDLVSIGLQMTKESGELPRCADFGEEAPSWRTIYTSFGSLPSYHEEINVKRGKSHKRQALLTTGVRLTIENGRKITERDLPSGKLTAEEIFKAFGEWSDFLEEMEVPKVKIREDLVPTEELLREVGIHVEKRVTGKDLSTWQTYGIFPRGFRSGRKGMYSKTLVPLAIKIQTFHEGGLSLTEIRDFMAITGSSSYFAAKNVFPKFVVFGGTYARTHAESVDVKENREKISLADAVKEINKRIENINFHIKIGDMKRWTYNDELNQKMIPDRLKVPGERAYLIGVVDLVIRIRELQSYNRTVEEIREILAAEYETGLKVALCNECGEIQEGYTDGTAVCKGCLRFVLYRNDL